jgi:hypothetical protein
MPKHHASRITSQEKAPCRLARTPPNAQNRRTRFTGAVVSDIVYTADIRIDRIEGPHRLAWLPAHDGPVEFGVHGAIREHYGATHPREITTTLDSVMAATGG